jgi:hypothetical protein
VLERLYCPAEPLPLLQIGSLCAIIGSTEYQPSPIRLRAVCQELLTPSLPITDRQNGWFPATWNWEKPGKPGQAMNAVRLGRSKSQPQSEGRMPGNPLSPVCIPRPGGNAADLLPFVSHRVPREKTALHPRNSLPLAAVCRTQVPKGRFWRPRCSIDCAPATQDLKPAHLSISPRQKHKRPYSALGQQASF